MGASGEHRDVVLATLAAIEKKIDMLVGIVQSIAKRQTHLESRMAAYDRRSEPDFGNGAVESDE